MSTDLALMTKSPSGSTGDVLDVVRHLREFWDLADILLKGGMLPNSIKTPEAAMSIMLKGRELGIGPMAAFAGINVIQGKAAVSPQLMLSLAKGKGLLARMTVEEFRDGVTVCMWRKGEPEPYRDTFTMDDAKKMQLAGKDNWVKQPKVMMRWRCVAAVCRLAFPDVIDGLYTPEEMGAEVDEDGGIVTAEVVEVRAVPQNHSGHGRGQYASPEQVREFTDFVKVFFDKRNGEWADSWQYALDRGLGVPTDDVMHPLQLKNHLLKWAVDFKPPWLDPALDLKSISGDQPEKYLGIIYANRRGGRNAIIAESLAYWTAKADEKRQAIYKKSPDLRPDDGVLDAELVPPAGDNEDADDIPF